MVRIKCILAYERYIFAEVDYEVRILYGLAYEKCIFDVPAYERCMFGDLAYQKCIFFVVAYEAGTCVVLIEFWQSLGLIFLSRIWSLA